VPSVRFSRDKRGYEYVYLVHTPTRRGKPGRTRVLYWYRTPPGVRIGRKPFDEEVQRTLERQNPGVTFDWETIINTPMPPPDMAEFWRERRRAEKAARQERQAIDAGTEEAAPDAVATEPEPPREQAEVDLVVGSDEAMEQGSDAVPNPDESLAVERDAAVADADASEGSTSRRRRRRRGGRRRRPGAEGSDPPVSNAAEDAPETMDGGGTADSDEPSDETDTTSEEE
jgi:ribonuclease E